MCASRLVEPSNTFFCVTSVDVFLSSFYWVACPLKPLLRAKLERCAERLAELDFLMSRDDIMGDSVAMQRLAREHRESSALVKRWQELQAAESDLRNCCELLADPELAPELQSLAAQEQALVQDRCQRLTGELQSLLLPQDPEDSRAAFLEIRAGAGGDESALFAADLRRMYCRYADQQGWRVELLSESASELGGCKEVVLRISGEQVYGRLRFESGGHRVQRVPSTESQGRIHTSACTVAVMPEPDPVQTVALNPAELRIDTFRASGAGGQHVNKTDSAVRITHLPTGIVAECQDDRSQHRNKARALQVLTARIAERERCERSALEASQRKGLIGSGDRSDRIRTYNFPQGRLTDHRVNITWYKLLAIMDGQIGVVLDALQSTHQAERLEALGLDA